MSCFTLTVLFFSVVIPEFTAGNERELEVEGLLSIPDATKNQIELLDTMNNNGTVHQMSLVKTAAILKHLDSRINKKEQGPTPVKKNEAEAATCTEAMNTIARFYETFTIDDQEVINIFPAMSDITFIMKRNDVHIKKLMNESALSFPITNLIRNAHEIPNVKEKFREIVAEKMAAERRRVNDISSAANESRESIESDESKASLKSSHRRVPSNTDVLVPRRSMSPASDSVTKKSMEDESLVGESAILYGDKSSIQSTDDLWALETMKLHEKSILEDEDARQNLKTMNVLKKKLMRHDETIPGLHKIMWEEALSAFGSYIPSVANFFNLTLHHQEAFLTSIHDMIPNGVSEFVPYWDYIARQATNNLQNTDSADTGLRKLRNYVIEVETQKRQILNYGKVPVASVTLLLNAKRLSDFTVVF